MPRWDTQRGKAFLPAPDKEAHNSAGVTIQQTKFPKESCKQKSIAEIKKVPQKLRD